MNEKRLKTIHKKTNAMLLQSVRCIAEAAEMIDRGLEVLAASRMKEAIKIIDCALQWKEVPDERS